MNLRNHLYLIFALLLLSNSCTISTSNTEKEPRPFSFVQLCDPQLGMGGYDQDVESFQLAVEQINEVAPDFVIICGDLVNNASESSFSDFLKIKEGFNMPCYVAPGNHDVGNIPSAKTLSNYRKIIGNDYYDFNHKGYLFIVTNSQLWKSDVKNESQQHDDWFKETINNQEQYPTIVIGHYPLYNENPEEEELYFNFPVSKRQELLQLFTQHNVLAYLSGHTHMLVINNYENIQLVSGETTSKNFDNRPFGFRLWHVSSDTVEHRFISLQDSIIEK